jgi:hypothetical protein
MPDIARPSATQHSLSIDDVSRLFDEAGLPRNVRTLQRTCAAGRLDCVKGGDGEPSRLFGEPVSVERAIKRLAQLHGLTDGAPHRAIMTDGAPERQSAPGAALNADGWIASLCSR